MQLLTLHSGKMLSMASEKPFRLSMQADESVWRNLRETIGTNGFTFEYSATFGQIAQNFKDFYAKNIIFDYSYGKFHHDGYGKQFWINNLTDNKLIEQIEHKRQYLLLNLLLILQQKIIYSNNIDMMKEYPIHNPLMLFIGHTVNPKLKGKQDQKDNEITVSDVKRLFYFFYRTCWITEASIQFSLKSFGIKEIRFRITLINFGI